MKIKLINSNLVFAKQIVVTPIFEGVMEHSDGKTFTVSGFTPEADKSYLVNVKITSASTLSSTASLYFKRGSSVVSNVAEGVTSTELNEGVTKTITSTQGLGVTINLYFAERVADGVTFNVKVYDVDESSNE